MKELQVDKTDKSSILLKIDGRVFEKQAILNTTYKFTDICFINIEFADNQYQITLKLKQEGSDLNRISDEFGNELIDQQIRLQTGREFKEIREQLVKRAFSSITK